MTKRERLAAWYKHERESAIAAKVAESLTERPTIVGYATPRDAYAAMAKEFGDKLDALIYAQLRTFTVEGTHV